MEQNRVQELEKMLAHEEGKHEPHYGASLSHWWGDTKTISIDAGGIRALLEYYRSREREELCSECESKSCGFNHDGECRFPMVHERPPHITDEDGCVDYDYCEG